MILRDSTVFIRKLPTLLAFFLLLAIYVNCSYADNSNNPIKLELRLRKEPIIEKSPTKFTITLLNADNKDVVAQRDWPVKVEIESPNGERTVQDRVIKSGSPSQMIETTPSKPGIYHITASNEELLNGEIYFNVVSSHKKGGDTEVRNPGGTDLSDLLAMQFDRPIQIIFRATQRKILADNADAATIKAMVTDQSTIAPVDIHIELHNADGTLQPQELIIPRGRFSGAARLTSKDSGAIKVEYVSSAPHVQVVGNKSLNIKFIAPITHMKIQTSPPIVSLTDDAYLIIELLGKNETPLVSDQDRTVSFTINEGLARLEKQAVTIPAGSYQTRVLINPIQTGNVKISAATPNLNSETTTLSVKWPVLLLIISAVGGLCGGFLVYLNKKPSSGWRLFTGLITGLLLYWLVIFGGLDVIPRNIALNQLSAFALSVIGGWLGTKVISIITDRFGLT